MTRKMWLPLLLFMAVALAACARTNGVEGTPTDAGQVVGATQPPATRLPTLPPAPSAQPACTVVSQESVLPMLPAVESDWTHGSDNPRVTIIEYSDFQ
jgi:hypothetical protein